MNTKQIDLRITKLEEAVTPATKEDPQMIVLEPEETDQDEAMKKAERLQELHSQRGAFNEDAILWIVFHLIRQKERGAA